MGEQFNTRFAIGDTVFHPQVEHTSEDELCPDCKGAKTWAARLPSGEELTIGCATCERGFSGSQGTIKVGKVSGRVEVLTVGRVSVNTGKEPGKREEYMCRETGVGSGRLYYLEDLLATEEQAAAKLPWLLEVRERDLAESQAKSRASSKAEKAGHMEAYFRSSIRSLEKDIDRAKAGLARCQQIKP